MSGKCKNCIDADLANMICSRTGRSIVPDPEFCSHYHYSKIDYLHRLNKTFSRRLLEVCRGKNVLLTFTGGLDTRAILAVLSKHKVPIDAVTYWRSQDAAQRKDRDIEITTRIAKHVPCIRQHLVVKEKWVGHCESGTGFQDLAKDYDVVLMGMLMSETFCKYENFHHSERAAIDTYEVKVQDTRLKNANAWVPPNVYLPGGDKEVQEALLNIPMMYRGFSSAQRYIILKNDPRLMRFPYTSFNFRYFLFRAAYWRFLSLMEFMQ